MRCTYCYGDGGGYGSSGEMSRETAFAAVDWLVAQSGRTKQLRICFFGGEPLLNVRLIEQVVPYAREKAEHAEKKIGFGITTNASLLDDERLEFLQKHDIMPLVSFDGPKAIQDRQRPFKNGDGSYDAVVGRIRKLLKVFPDAECRVTLVGDSDVAEIESSLKQIGFKSWRITAASQSLIASESKGSGVQRELSGMVRRSEGAADELLAALRRRDAATLKALPRPDPLYRCVEQFANNRKRFFACSAGRAMVGVSASGGVYLCHRFVGGAGAADGGCPPWLGGCM